ncbi:glycosyltransferase [Actinoplanes teichomyceticus]|uniref:Glycosyltransferase involved in cell wall biosynthesis n=1 Tax=Actinoplanes teichomyceticus TaxID=1867 RepID=A0A561WKZ1_ACTTI|nr:glycosyltransferase [Actinoplanes teichomyceticus]TWG24532.1 glycosyltransferase involved in cell wall biosynthesis [Actinoplanes teichomyceticus]GIF16829.1 hypothetical protein Ate01nite_68610 [Actinoplanes teichomyceticus]
MPSADRVTVLEASGVGPGGITRVLTELARHWPAGHQLRIVAAPADWEVPASAAAVSVLSAQSGGRAATITGAAAALRRATAAGSRVLSLSPSLAIRGSRAPVTTIMHDLAFRLWPHGLSPAVLQYRRLSYRTAVDRSARLLCVSARTRHDLLGVYGVGYHRTAVWHPGSDLSTAPGRSPVTGEKPYLLVAGHAAHKGVELAIEAAGLLTPYEIVVLTGGKPDLWGPPRPGVRFLGRLTDAEYAAAVAGAAAVLMPSHFEGYGLPAAEALRLGTPVVISPDPALLEATAGAAVRMTTWTAEALADAVRAAVAGPRPATAGAGRSWQEATDHLVELLGPVATPAGG